jgi:hypothetical protein
LPLQANALPVDRARVEEWQGVIRQGIDRRCDLHAAQLRDPTVEGQDEAVQAGKQGRDCVLEGRCPGEAGDQDPMRLEAEMPVKQGIAELGRISPIG